MNVMTITSAWKYGRSFSSRSKCLCALTVEKCIFLKSSKDLPILGVRFVVVAFMSAYIVCRKYTTLGSILRMTGLLILPSFMATYIIGCSVVKLKRT